MHHLIRCTLPLLLSCQKMETFHTVDFQLPKNQMTVTNGHIDIAIIFTCLSVTGKK